jgi:hypothetical protein
MPKIFHIDFHEVNITLLNIQPLSKIWLMVFYLNKYNSGDTIAVVIISNKNEVT